MEQPIDQPYLVFSRRPFAGETHPTQATSASQTTEILKEQYCSIDKIH